MPTPDSSARADHYLRRVGATREALLGWGKDADVWRTSRPSALKIHNRRESYLTEREAYIRLAQLRIVNLCGFNVPELLGHDDQVLAIEMTIVFPPFVVDFASAVLDTAPDLIEDEGHTLFDLVQDRFGTRAAEVMALRDELARCAGVHLSDLHPQNIKFRE